jgi:hypothetical protein
MEENQENSSSVNYSQIEGMLGELKTQERALCRHHSKAPKTESNNNFMIITEESHSNKTNTPKSKKTDVESFTPHQCTFFCNLCDEPVCLKCIQEGPHNTFAHQIIKIEKAAETKLEKLRATINSNLLPERQELIKEIEIANYIQNTLLVKVFSDIKSEMAKDFWTKIGSTERYINDQVMRLDFQIEKSEQKEAKMKEFMKYYEEFEQKAEDCMETQVEFIKQAQPMNDFLESLLFEDEENLPEFDLEKIPFDVYKMQETDVLNYKFKELVDYRKQFIVNIINEKKRNYNDLLQK